MTPRKEKRAGRRLICFPLLLIFLFSCSPRVRENASVRLLPVPFHPQEDYQCGPASLAGVINFWGVNVRPEEIASAIFSPSARGTLDLDLVFYAQKKGFRSIQYRGSPETLRQGIDSGRPLIVMVDHGFWKYEKNHFMVVVGYDGKGVIVNSGREQGKYLAWKGFQKTWERADFWTLEISPP